VVQGLGSGLGGGGASVPQGSGLGGGGASVPQGAVVVAAKQHTDSSQLPEKHRRLPG